MRKLAEIAVLAMVSMAASGLAAGQTPSGTLPAAPPASPGNAGPGVPSGLPQQGAPSRPGGEADSGRAPAPRGCRYRERKLELIV